MSSFSSFWRRCAWWASGRGGASAARRRITSSPDGGCPERFYLSRRWSIGQDGVTIGDDANNALGVLTFSGGQFAGKSAAGTPVTLSRQKPAL